MPLKLIGLEKVVVAEVARTQLAAAAGADRAAAQGVGAEQRNRSAAEVHRAAKAA